MRYGFDDYPQWFQRKYNERTITWEKCTRHTEKDGWSDNATAIRRLLNNFTAADTLWAAKCIDDDNDDTELIGTDKLDELCTEESQVDR